MRFTVVSARTAIVDELVKAGDWVPIVESVVNDLVFAAIAVVFLWAFPAPLPQLLLPR